MFEWIDTTSQSKDDHLVFVSRLPHRRLLDRIDVSKVETYWMTHRVGQAHIAPDLEQIHDLILSRISNHHGCVILEGLEWLVTLHGEKVMLNFVRSLRDDLHRTQWSILIPIQALAFNSIWLARFHREAPEIDLEIEGHTEVEIHVAEGNWRGTNTGIDLNRRGITSSCDAESAPRGRLFEVHFKKTNFTVAEDGS
jgi:hypothetical protein